MVMLGDKYWFYVELIIPIAIEEKLGLATAWTE